MNADLMHDPNVTTTIAALHTCMHVAFSSDLVENSSHGCKSMSHELPGRSIAARVSERRNLLKIPFQFVE